MKLVPTLTVLALVGAAGTAFVGVPRISALCSQARSSINDTIDSHIQDPTLLRKQMADLHGKYPDQIAEVQGELASLEQQIADLQREQQVADRVVTLTGNDLTTLDSALGNESGFRNVSFNGSALIDFNGNMLTPEQAKTEASRIRGIRSVYAGKTGDISNSLVLLEQQRERLSDLLTRLETEYAEFQTSVWQLDQDIDAIARNDRMIEMIEQRQKTVDQFESRYNSPGSLDSINSRVANIRAQQEARLRALAQTDQRNDYENQARQDLGNLEADYLNEADEIVIPTSDDNWARGDG